MKDDQYEDTSIWSISLASWFIKLSTFTTRFVWFSLFGSTCLMIYSISPAFFWI